MRFLLNKLIHALVKWCEKTNRVYKITGGGDTVYLVRYIVFKSKYGCFYIHRFMRSDSDDPHDHPWNFITYIVSGGYKEKFYDLDKPTQNSNAQAYFGADAKFTSFWTPRTNVRLPGSFAFRRATDIHQVVVDRPYLMHEIEQAPLTACIMFSRQRNWGFWPLKDRGSKFVDWRRYLKVTPDDPRIVGSE